ncbi:hypothetical protein [Streptomyces sp. ISL-36]|uniref:hypothetical protein n=1 Tax=Streptomyces sp. ISL-36 TaxID=2819182 RepID=UPI002035B6B7|nr:hypothetical protein [Streptomyces sp. ISL-36]
MRDRQDAPAVARTAGEGRQAAAPRRLGATAEARKARAQADALDRKIRNCIDAEDNHKPWN